MNHFNIQSTIMKKTFGLLAAVFISIAAMSQGTPEQKKELNKDIKKEGAHRAKVAKNLVTGKPKAAKAEHKKAVAANKEIRQDVAAIHDRDVKRAKAKKRAKEAAKKD